MLIVADMNGKIFESSDFADEKYVEYREKSDDDPGIHEFLRGGGESNFGQAAVFSLPE